MFGGKWLAVVEKKETTTQKFVSKIVWKLPPIFGMKIEKCILKNISFSKISTKRSIFKTTKGSQRGASGTSTGATVATCTSREGEDLNGIANLSQVQPFWSLQTSFDPICLRLFLLLGGLLFLGLFWGLQDTDCTSRCIRYLFRSRTPTKKQEARTVQTEGDFCHTWVTQLTLSIKTKIFISEREGEGCSALRQKNKQPAAHSQEGKQPFLSFMPHSGHYKHALTPSAFGFSTSLAGSFFSAFSGAWKTQLAHLGASDSIQINSSAHCGGLLPHVSHTTRATHAKHQNPSIVSKREACSTLRHKHKTTCSPQPRRLAAIPYFHSLFWPLQTCFDPICLWLFFLLGWLLFLGLENTACTSRCIRYLFRSRTPTKKQEARTVQTAGDFCHTWVTQLTLSIKTKIFISEREGEGCSALRQKNKQPAAHSQEGKQPFLSFMPHSGHYKHALTPSAFGFSTSLAGSFFSAFSGAWKTQLAHLGASASIQINSSANCGGLLPHVSHTTRATHAKHQNQNLYFREKERELLSIQKNQKKMKPPTTHSQKRKEPLWSLPTCFDPICLWLFHFLDWLLFLSLFWGLQDTDCTSGCIRCLFKSIALTKNRSKSSNGGWLLPHVSHTTRATHAKHQNPSSFKEGSLFNIETQAQNHLQPTAKKASSHSLFSFAILAITNMLWPHLPLAFLPPWLAPFSRPFLGPGRHSLHI